jgi:hypothetical protein
VAEMAVECLTKRHHEPGLARDTPLASFRAEQNRIKRHTKLLPVATASTSVACLDLALHHHEPGRGVSQSSLFYFPPPSVPCLPHRLARPATDDARHPQK